MATSYKYCFVQTCVNTTINSPKKVFIHVPPDPDVRKKWCQAAGYPWKKLKRSSYCCEDHFDLENDLENYRYWKTVGGRKRLKPGVVPRFFINLHTLNCNSLTTNNELPPPPLPSSSSASIYEEISPNTIVKKEIIYLKSDDLDVDDNDMNINNYDTEDYYYYQQQQQQQQQQDSDCKPPNKCDVSIQANLREHKIIKKDKAVQCLLLTDSSVQVN